MTGDGSSGFIIVMRRFAARCSFNRATTAARKAYRLSRRFCGLILCHAATASVLIALLARSASAQALPVVPRKDAIELARLSLARLPFDSLSKSHPKMASSNPIVLIRDVTMGHEPTIFRSSTTPSILAINANDVPIPSTVSWCCGSLRHLRNLGEQYGSDTVWIFLAISQSEFHRVAHVVTSISFGGTDVDVGLTFYFYKRHRKWILRRYAVDAM